MRSAVRRAEKVRDDKDGQGAEKCAGCGHSEIEEEIENSGEESERMDGIGKWQIPLQAPGSEREGE